MRRAEPHMWEVTNKAEGRSYHVRFHRLPGGLFASCDCPAGTRHHKAPMVCKHLAAAPLCLFGLVAGGMCPAEQGLLIWVLALGSFDHNLQGDFCFPQCVGPQADFRVGVRAPF